MRKLVVAASMVALALVAQVPLAAQSEAEYFGLFSFRSQNPGARARGIGGAFVALADDATAAYVNPAGLAYLDRWEVSAEYSRDEVGKGQVAQASYNGNYRATIEGGTSSSVDFASAVFPIKKGRLTAAAYYADLSPVGDKSFSFARIPGYVGSESYFYDADTYVTAENKVFGASLGWRLSDRFSLGASVGQSKLDFAGYLARYDQRNGHRFLNSANSQVDGETAVFVTVGALAQVTERIGLGFSWQKETSYDMTYSVYQSDATLFKNGATQFTIPTKWALGLSIRATDSLVFAIEADRIEYGDLHRGMSGENLYPSDDPGYGYAVDAVTELHAGVEYTFFAGSVGMSLRGGYWLDKEHLPYYTGTDIDTLNRQPKRDDKFDHFTAGVGLAFKHFMIDFAGDYSDQAGTDYLGSVVFRF